MTTTGHTCRRCHGSGAEPPGPNYNARQEAVLDRLGELGVERGELQSTRAYMTTEGRAAYNSVLGKIRTDIAKAQRLDIRKIDMQDALGLSSAAFYKILTGQTGK